LKFNQNTANVFLSVISDSEIKKAVKMLPDLLKDRPKNNKGYVEKNFENIFFTTSENIEIDNFCQNILNIDKKIKSILVFAVGQALLKKRPYNLFHRAKFW
jgi:adenine-specific DNA-methyltransferase